MKRNKGMQVFAMLAVMLLLSMAFVPAVSAEAEKAGKRNAPDATIDEWIVDKEDKKEYKATIKQADIEMKYYVKQWQEKVDGIKVWKFNVYEISPDGVIAQDISFGRGSYFWTDSAGIHFQFSESDKELIMIIDGTFMALIGLILATVNPLIGGAFATIMAGVIGTVSNIESNDDGSIDVFISWWNLGKIPIYMIQPGAQYIEIKIGSHNYPVPL
ncbi:MAG: hypothetical protein SCH39_00290 [Methanosarcinales archaeon]|nr:hypothetical protein [Methanosarcinales archaeon]